MEVRRTVLFIVVAALCAAGVAQADEKCALQKVASVPLTITPSGVVTLPVTVAGDNLTFSLEINDGFSAIASDYAKKRGFHLSSHLPALLQFDFLNGTATAPDVVLGDLSLKSVQFLHGDIARKGTPAVIGTIGLNLLENYDIEIDFKNNKLILYSQDHCPGNVAYWASSYAVIPFAQDAANNITYQLKLDDKPVSAEFSLHQGYGFVSSATAKQLVGLNSVDGLTKTGDMLWGKEETYAYPFQSLEIGPFTFKHPKIYVYQGEIWCKPSRLMRCLGAPDIFIGTDQLQRLHLFYAFKEGKLYVTTADAHL